MTKPILKRISIVVAALMLAAVATAQIREIIKILGVGAAVKQFGPDINRAINKMVGREDTPSKATKVVPIITIGLNTRGAIGAAQVMGSKQNVDKVRAVAAPEADLFGKEIKIRALIPVNSDNITELKDIKPVDGVGVSGIVDLSL
ncbi:hypothetical protein QPK87_30855 [Kamptonema cortianum]|nr:hypothetical protein [Geitlerinema splendidum]MDK3160925.1 hypothetical protein [Kamptonema cortianum]